ncbi:hypothetical protein KSS87_005993 [Heliosperma pusillum]|nr:hypothetical protein KSS87_005993 [Heliosperma pusillum]
MEDTLTSLSRAYALILREERHKAVTRSREDHTEVAMAARTGGGRGRGSTYVDDQKDYEPPRCSFCNKWYHTEENCWEKLNINGKGRGRGRRGGRGGTRGGKNFNNSGHTVNAATTETDSSKKDLSTEEIDQLRSLLPPKAKDDINQGHQPIPETEQIDPIYEDNEKNLENTVLDDTETAEAEVEGESSDAHEEPRLGKGERQKFEPAWRKDYICKSTRVISTSKAHSSQTPSSSKGHATVFVAKFFGRAGLMSFISNVPLNQRPALFQSLLYEACGRTVNPVSGAVGLLWTGNWHVCQAAVETVLRGGTLGPIPEFLITAPPSPTSPDSDEVSEVVCPLPSRWKNNPFTPSPPRFSNSKRRRPAVDQKSEHLDLSLTPPPQRPGTPSFNSEESATTTTTACFDNYRYQAVATTAAVMVEPKLLELFL